MLKQFIAFMDTEEWNLDSMQIAEALWFVQQVSPLVPKPDERGRGEETSESEDLIEGSGKQEDKSSDNKKAPPSHQYPLTIPPSRQSASPTPIEQTSFPTEKLPIKLPDTGIFRNTLELGRLTKPLKQKINSRIAQELDVKKTVKRSAELSTPQFPRYFPVLTPKKERWLDVALLIEDSESMIFWQSLLKEVQDFLEHLGVFRDIKPYQMNWDDDKKNLQISSFHSLSNYLSPQGLNDPGGRRLILIVSDCISSAWTSDKFIEILKQWSTKGQLTLLNPFPERMWERTNLGYSIKIRLGNEKKGLPTQKWLAIPLESWQVKGVNEQTKQTLVKLPILSLEPESMGAWVNVMMGKGTSLCSGVWLGSNFMYPEDEDEDDDEENLTPLQQINNFYATSSQLAWELIQWLSAIPVSLSTIRLVQRTLLPKSTQVNVAEVVMGGLLSPVKPLNSYQSQHQIQFEFKPGIREAFLNRLGEEEFCLGVIGSLTEKIASHFGYQTVREFEAILLNNTLKLRVDDDIELIQAFATISVSTLRQYGGEYAAYIRKLDRSRARLNLLSAVEGDSVSLNWIDFLEGIAQQNHLTDIETETLINLLPTPQKTCSIPEVAKHLLSSVSAIRSRLTNIYRKFENQVSDLFQSKRHNKFKTLQLYLYSQYLKSTSPQFPELETFEVFEFEAEVAIIIFEEDEYQLKTILLVEDEPTVIKDISEVLSSQYGISVIGNDEVNEVIKLAESGQIDLILINYGLPNSHYQGKAVDGLEIIPILRANPNISSSLPIVGFSLDLVASEFRISGANGFYSKEELFDSGNYQKFVDYLQEIFRRNDFEYYLDYGNSEPSSIAPQPGILLIGGAEGGTSAEDAATRWFLERAKHGNYLVLRGGRIGRQAQWIAENYRDLIKSAAELAIYSREAANNPDVVQYIRDADALYFPGADSIGYENYWEGTATEDAINYLINQKKVPVGGTGIGMAILGDYYYAPARQGLLSSEILNDPFHENTQDIYRSNFLQVPFLKDVITDTHLDRCNDNHPETRYGRLFGFLARMIDEKGLPAYGIGLEEGAFVAIDENGIATAFGNAEEPGADVYFLQAQETPERIEPGKPLIWDRNGKAVKVYRIRGTAEGSGSFDLNDWESASGGSWEYWYTTDGERGFTGPKSRVRDRGEKPQTPPPLPTFTFETVSVNGRGEISNREAHTAQYYTESLPNNVSLDMVAIPGGTFTMGSPENEGYGDEHPQHNVTISPFFIGKYPVTQAQWKAIASQDELKVEIDLDPDRSEFKGDDRPVETVNWYEAVEFCQRLSKLTGRDYRLPSEAEWEYACRGVTEPLNLEKGESYSPFYFGETITSDLANYDASSTYADERKGKESKETTTVGQFSPNAFGLYDMHGNVWEWCQDGWHENYKGAPTDGSAWLDSNDGENINTENESYSDKNDENESYSVLRGGSWSSRPVYCRSASRVVGYRRDGRDVDVGFRVVCGFGRTL